MAVFVCVLWYDCVLYCSISGLYFTNSNSGSAERISLRIGSVPRGVFDDL